MRTYERTQLNSMFRNARDLHLPTRPHSPLLYYQLQNCHCNHHQQHPITSTTVIYTTTTTTNIHTSIKSIFHYHNNFHRYYQPRERGPPTHSSRRVPPCLLPLSPQSIESLQGGLDPHYFHQLIYWLLPLSVSSEGLPGTPESHLPSSLPPFLPLTPFTCRH